MNPQPGVRPGQVWAPTSTQLDGATVRIDGPHETFPHILRFTVLTFAGGKPAEPDRTGIAEQDAFVLDHRLLREAS